MSCRADKCSAISHGTGMNWAPTMMHGFCSAERERLAQALLPRTSGPHGLNLFWETKRNQLRSSPTEWCNLSGVWGPFILLRVKHDLKWGKQGGKRGGREREKSEKKWEEIDEKLQIRLNSLRAKWVSVLCLQTQSMSVSFTSVFQHLEEHPARTGAQETFTQWMGWVETGWRGNKRNVAEVSYRRAEEGPWTGCHGPQWLVLPTSAID